MRLIDADALLDNTTKHSIPRYEIVLAPTADAELIKHGTNISSSSFLCSECGFGDFDGFHGYKPKYCPECGARMDKEGD